MSSDQKTNIHDLAKANDVDGIKILLTTNPRAVNQQNNLGWAPLHGAAEKNSIGTMQHLLDFGAKVDIQNMEGKTPLHEAAWYNSKKAAELLIANNANVDLQNRVGESPLYVAAQNDARKTVQLLLKSGANVDLNTTFGESPLHAAARYNRRSVAQLLIENRAKINLQNKSGESPLYVAVRWNKLDVSQLLLESGANIDLQDNNGKTPLIVAKEEGFDEMVTLLENHKKKMIEFNIKPLSKRIAIQLTCNEGGDNYANCEGLYLETSTELNDHPVFVCEDHGRFIGWNGTSWILTGMQWLDGLVAKQERGFGGYHKSINGNVSIEDSIWVNYTVMQESDAKAISNIQSKVEAACQNITSKWNRSKIMIVGEGRAGKTALANSIMGKPFISNYKSTIGIDQFSCSVNYADARNGQWNLYDRPEKECETAISLLIKDEHTMKSNIIDFQDPNLENINKSVDTNISTEDARSSPANIPAVAKVIRGLKPGDIDNDFVAKCLADNIQTSSDLIISLFDFGGQSVFDVIHHLFLTPYGVYIVVFNMMWLMESATPEDYESCKSRMKYWVNSIMMHTYNSLSMKSAPIVFVGTHRDSVNDRRTMDSISETIFSMFGSIEPCWDSVIKNDKEGLCFFPVNNVEGRDEGIFPDMLQKIENFMMNEDFVTQEKPLIWLQALDKLKNDKSKVSFTISEAHQMLEACGIEENEYPIVLSLFNKMGELLWINEDGLRDTIIMDPITFFVTHATNVICKHVESEERGDVYRHENEIINGCKNIYPVQWEAMVTSGVVASELLVVLLGNDHEVILQLMLKFGLLIKATKDYQDVERQSDQSMLYLVPSLLPLKNRETISGEFPDFLSDHDEVQNSFLFFFGIQRSKPTLDLSDTALNNKLLKSEGFMPNGLFVRFLVKVIDWSQLSTKNFDIVSKHMNQSDVTIEFGNRTFRLRWMEDLNSICITVIKCKNYAGLLMRLRGIMSTVIDECFSSLYCQVFFLKYDEAKCWYLIPEQALNDKGQYVEYSKRWKLPDTSQNCDVFLSYRRSWHDQKFVSLVYDSLLDPDYKFVFLDIKVIEDDNNNIEEIQETFTKALINCKVFVPFISRETLLNMKIHNPQVIDNVLLEWILALECHQQGKLSILPIPYGDIDENDRISVLDRDRELRILSDVHSPSATLLKAKELLAKNEFSHTLVDTENLTISKIFEKILDVSSLYSINSLKHCVFTVINRINMYYKIHLNKERELPLFVVINKNDVEQCDILIQNGADCNISDQFGYTPLHWAVITRIYFLDNNNSLNEVDSMVLKDNEKICQILLAAGAEIHKTNNESKSPLMLAREKGFTEIVALLEQQHQEQYKTIEDNLVYHARCGSVYEGIFGRLPYAFKFYDNLIIQGTTSSKTKTIKIEPVTIVEQATILREFLKTKDISNDCEYVVKVYDIIFDPLFKEVVLVTELPFNSLYYIIHMYYPLPDEMELSSTLKLEIIQDLVSAVSFLHDNNIVHNDINTSNILLFESATGQVVAKLGGFGITRALDQLAVEKLKNREANMLAKLSMGTIAPELLPILSEEVSLVFTKESDIYALGITMNEIMTERPPYPFADSYEYYVENILMKGNRPNIFISNGSQIENALRDIISQSADSESIYCLAQDMEHRPRIHIISNILTQQAQDKLWNDNREITEEKVSELTTPSSVPTREATTSTTTNYVIQNICPIMQYTVNNTETLFVDNGEYYFEGKELFLLVKSLLSEKEKNAATVEIKTDENTEAAYQFIYDKLLDTTFVSKFQGYLIKGQYQVQEDSLGYYAYDTLKYRNSNNNEIAEDDRIRGVELHFIADLFRDYDQKSELAYQFIKTELDETIIKIRKYRQIIDKDFKSSRVILDIMSVGISQNNNSRKKASSNENIPNNNQQSTREGYATRGNNCSHSVDISSSDSRSCFKVLTPDCRDKRRQNFIETGNNYFGLGIGLPRVNEIIDMDYDLKLFEQYCDLHYNHKYATYFPSSLNTLDNLKQVIERYYQMSLEVNSYLVIYYTGHGREKGGDWEINSTPEIFTLPYLHNLLKKNVANRPGHENSRKEIFIILDSCYSGHWTEKLRQNKCKVSQIRGGMFTLFKEIVASCRSDETTDGNFFSIAMWGNDQTDQTAWRFSLGAHGNNDKYKVEYNLPHFLTTPSFQSDDVFRGLSLLYEEYCWGNVFVYGPHYYNIEDTQKTLLVSKNDFRGSMIF